MYTYPHTIDNGGGEQLTFLGVVEDSDGERLDVTNQVAPGSGPPMHVHFFQEESLTVRKGKIGYQILGQEAQYAEEGETVTFAPGVTHKFWNAGQDVLECEGYIRPPDSIEYFLTEIYASTRENNGKQPNPFDAAFLAHRYRSEFAMKEIPTLVQTVLFPVFRMIGKFTGRYSKYRNAPEPIHH